MASPMNHPFNVMRHHGFEAAPRDPITIGSAILSGLGITVGSTFVISAVGYIATTLVTSWALSALAPKPDFGALSSRGTLVNAREAAAAHQIVYGQMRKGGTITFIEATGEKNEHLHLIIALAGHAVDQIGDIFVDDTIVTIDGSGNVTDAFLDGEGNPTMRIKKYDGTQIAPPADLLAESELTGADALDSNFVGRGIAYLYVRMKYDQNAYPNGIPLFTAVVRGKKVYDPRSGQTVWSDNAALCVRDYITSDYGLGDSNIDDTVFSAAANICDELVTLSGLGTVKRYTINGVVQADSSHGTILSQMMTACAGTLFWGTGKWKLVVADYVTPTKTLTMDDLRSGITVQTRNNLRDQFNVVQGTFINADERWITQDYPPIKGAGFITEDGNIEQALDLPLPFTTNSATAQRLAKLTLYRGREQMVITADFGMNAFNVEVGEIIELTIERYGWAAKEFEVIGWQLRADQDAGDLRVALTLRETSEAAFDWNAEEQDIIANNTVLPSFSSVPAVSFVGSPTTETIIRADGGAVSNAIVQWAPSTDAFVFQYVLRWRKTTDQRFQSIFTSGTYHVIQDVTTGVPYDIDIAALNSLGVRSARTSSIVAFTADQSAPSAPTPAQATGGFNQVAVKWTNPPQKDLKEVQVYANTTNSTSGATLVGVVSGDTFVHTGIPQNSTRFYFFKAVDFTGNVSGFSSSVSATTLADPQDGTPGENGDTIVTGRVYYQILQASSPATPSATSYNVATGTFTGLTANWALTQPSVDITDTSVREWSSQYQVRIDGTTSAQTISFTSPSGAIQVTADIESDNYVTGVSGWRIQRSTGNAEFQNATIRGTLNASDITAGTLNADRINIDGVTLDSVSGQLLIADAGVSSSKIAATLQSDNYVTGVSGWRIQRSTGNAEFQNATIRGTLNASDITAGTLNASRLSIDGVTLDTSGGQLVIKDSGVSTAKIATSAIVTSTIAARAATDATVATSSLITITASGSQSLGSFTTTEANQYIILQGSANAYGTGTGTIYSVGVLVDGVTAALFVNSTNDSYPTVGDVRFPISVLDRRVIATAGSHTLGLSYVISPGSTLELVSLDIVVTLLKR